MLVSLITAAAVAASAHGLQPVAEPATGETRWQLRVDSRDLDLRREADAREMVVRLRRASIKVCAKQAPIEVSRDYHGCRRATLDLAVQRLNEPLVSRALAEGA